MKLDKKVVTLIFIYLFSVLFVLYLADIYKQSFIENEPSSFNEIVSSKYKILYDTVYNYSLEHSTFKIYVGSSFSKDEDEVLFIDSDKISSNNLNRLISDFGYSYNINKGSVPFYIVFKDGTIKEIVHD